MRLRVFISVAEKNSVVELILSERRERRVLFNKKDLEFLSA